jgi:aspartate racemase
VEAITLKTIGLIGGMSWESTSVYYSYINRYVQQELGGIHSAKCLIYSFDFEEIAALQRAGDWDAATEKMLVAAKCLEAGGAELIVICTNTMHLMADAIKKAVRIPLIHIVDCVIEEIKKQNLSKVGLLGTRFTMEQSFYKDLLNQHHIEVVIPDQKERQIVHDVIFSELCRGECKESSRQDYINIINSLVVKGAEGIILGCTEIPLLITQKDTDVPLFDTTYLHATKASEFALKEKKIHL